MIIIVRIFFLSWGFIFNANFVNTFPLEMAEYSDLRCQCYLPLFRTSITTNNEDIPNSPAMNPITSNAAHTKGIKLRDMKVKLKVIFLSLLMID